MPNGEQSIRPEDLILALIRSAREQGVSGLTATAMVKYFYLVEHYSTQKGSEQHPLLEDWRFLHFGPFSPTLAQTIDAMESAGQLTVERREAGAEGEGEVRIYGLPDHARVPRLEDLSLPRGVPLRIATDIRRFRYELPKLLDFVYFETEPMQHAVPGERLTFVGPAATATRDDFHVFPLQLKADQARDIKMRVQRMASRVRDDQENAKKARVHAIYDASYMDFLAEVQPIDNDGEEELRGSVTFDTYQ